MTKKHLFFIMLSFCITQLFSQNNSIDTFEAKVGEYFNLDYETFYTHVNKTTFFKNEEIWFKTYVYNTKTQLPYISSTNIYTSLYNEDGKLITKKIYAASEGMMNGNIKIDSTYKTGTYYLKTNTNWSKNFSLNNSFVQKIEIINKIDKSKKKEEQVKLSYDFQLLPEGGHLIQEIPNTVGFKIINSFGKSANISLGMLMDSNNEIITLFKGNKFGIGKFVFKPQKGKNYHCKITLKDGEVITKKIESITHKGIGLNVINHKLKNTIININTNEDTLPELINESCYLIIHRDGLIKKIEVPFIKNKLNYSFKIKKSLLHSGINIVTLLNPKMKPIAERIIFNDYNSPIKNINVKEITKEKDSSIIKLQVTDSEIKNINLSISVLPSKTKANKHNSSIVSSLLINPYIKGKIENPWYYFNKINSEKKYNLDLLLLTQGWSKYYWGDIFNNPPKISYNFETGFLIKGKINTTFKKGDKMIVQSKENGFSQESVISKEGVFTFNKLFIAENSTINFSLKSKKEKYKKPKIYYNIYPTYIYNLLRINKKDNPNSIFLSEDLESFTFDKKAIILDEVKIKSANVKPKPKNSPRGMFLAKHINFENIQNQSTLITEKLRPYFNVSNNGGVVSITSRRYRSLYTQSKPVVFLDNVNISESLDIIADLRVFETEEMFVSTSNSSIYNAAGVIHLYTKRGVSKPNENKYSDSTVGFGFSIPKKYYNPIYNELNEENFKSYGVLNWVPNLTRDENGELSFKISNKFDGPINLYIEGIDKDGFLFSKIKTISSHISF